MKVGISRFFVVAVIAVVGVGVTPALAQSPDFSSFTSTTNLAFNGNAALFPATSPTVLRLTPAQGNQTGSAWFNVQQPVKNGFTTTFTFKITGGAGSPTSGDGIAFVIQNAGTREWAQLATLAEMVVRWVMETATEALIPAKARVLLTVLPSSLTHMTTNPGTGLVTTTLPFRVAGKDGIHRIMTVLVEALAAFPTQLSVSPAHESLIHGW